MIKRLLIVVLVFAASPSTAETAGQADPARDILVTFDNRGAAAGGAGINAPYRNRKRYAIAASARRHATAVAREYGLLQIDHWPIKSLGVYCFVYRVSDVDARATIIKKLQSDSRIESAQPLNTFEARADPGVSYDDTYANLQHGLTALDLERAHRYSTGNGVRVAIVDSSADIEHEDLAGRVRNMMSFTDAGLARDADHGTAVASIIGAIANNAAGIVGIAPASDLEIYVACWHDAKASKAVCDSFTLAKAIDTLLEHPPDVLNLSLTGPSDPLLARLLHKVIANGVIIIAAEPVRPDKSNHFPASIDGVIGVASSEQAQPQDPGADQDTARLYAPGDSILVALPHNTYDMRSGSSLAAAHVSGAVALLLAVSPQLSADNVRQMLHQSQTVEIGNPSVNACRLLRLADRTRDCTPIGSTHANQNESLTLNTNRASARSGELTIGTQRFVSW